MLTLCSSFRVGLLNDLETNDLRSLITEDDTTFRVKDVQIHSIVMRLKSPFSNTPIQNYDTTMFKVTKDAIFHFNEMNNQVNFEK